MSSPIRTVAPWAKGRDVVLVSTSDLPAVTAALREAGHTVADVAGEAGIRPMQSRIAEALHLPDTAGTNLDALVDALRDLDRWWPHARSLVLAWHDADLLVEHDLPGWLELVDILRGAARQPFAHPPDGGSLARFETLAGVSGHGVALSAAGKPGRTGDRAAAGEAVESDRANHRAATGEVSDRPLAGGEPQ